MFKPKTKCIDKCEDIKNNDQSQEFWKMFNLE